MPSIDYQIAKAFTAQSKWSDPKTIRGGLAELTADDIRAAISMATSPRTFHAMMAKYAQDPISEALLIEMMERESWLAYGAMYPDRQISRRENARLAEAAVLFYLVPEVRGKLGDAGHAAYLRCHRNTFAAKWKSHFKRITRLLFELEENAKREIWRMQRRICSPGAQ